MILKSSKIGIDKDKNSDNKTKICRYCKTEIDRSAKYCPNCRKAQKFSIGRVILGVIIGFAIIYLIDYYNEPRLHIDTDNNNSNYSNSCYATMEKFNKLENGMTYDEVVEIMGCDGTVSTDSDYFQSYYWYAKNGSSNITLIFIDGALNSKTQIGL